MDRAAMMSQTDENDRNPRQNQRPQSAPSHSIFSVPTPIKQLFDRFPLLTYPINELPQRAPRDRSAHVLYIFTSGEGARNGVPSYNPGCLKWQVCNISMPIHSIQTHYSQAYLKFSHIDFRIVSANNHASPSGALPFVIPASPEPYKHMQPVPSGKLQRWAMNNSKIAIEEPGDLRYEAYSSLLDHRVRRAWVCLWLPAPGLH
jgi:metaxin